jgi:hypothetical protein
MATSITFYLDTPSLSTATAIYSNPSMTALAPDGFYSDGTIVRQQSSGVLLPPSSCPNCQPTEYYPFSSSTVQASLIAACGSTASQVYYHNGLSGLQVGVNTYSDDLGASPLTAGYYFIGSGQSINVDASGVVLSIDACLYNQFTVYFDTTTAPNTYGWASQIDACAASGGTLPVYINGTATSLFDATVTQGLALYKNSGFTQLLEGNDTWFKTVAGAGAGATFQVSNAGEVNQWGSNC